MIEVDDCNFKIVKCPGNVKLIYIVDESMKKGFEKRNEAGKENSIFLTIGE